MEFKINYAELNKLNLADIGNTKFEGFIEKYMENFFENRIFSEFAKKEIYQEAEDSLKIPMDDKTSIGHWSGEFWGKLMISACRVCKYTGGSELKDFIEKAALKVISFARDDGYINSYKDSMNVFSPDPEKAFEIMGRDCDWNWNVRCRKYALWGLIECAELTGNDIILDAANKLANQLIDELNVMSSVGFNDIFANASTLENALSEPCDVIHWMRVCTELFTLTGDVKYADSVEKAFYNAFLAAVSDDGKWGARAVRSNCRNTLAEGQSGLKYNQCCLNNIPRGYINVVQFALMKRQNGLYINMYCPLSGKVKTDNACVSVKISDGYIENGKVSIIAETDNFVKVYLRKPDISGGNATLNGRKFTSSDGYFELNLEKGKTEINIDFDFKTEIHDFKYEVPRYDSEDFHILRWIPYGKDSRIIPSKYMMQERCAYLTYGPVLLSKSKKTGMTESEIFDFDTVLGKNFTASVQYKGSKDNFVMAEYDVCLENENSKFNLDMCTYATADDYNSEDDRFFNIYI